MDWLDDPGVHLVLRAVLVCVLLGVSGGLLGCVLLVRRLSLMADALAHSLLPGVGAAWLLIGSSVTALLVGGLVAGLVTALASGLLSRLTRIKEDAAFAALFTGMLGLGVLLISQAGTPADLLRLLFGQVLAVGPADLVLAAVASSVTVATFALGFRVILLECFDPIFHRTCGGRGAFVHLGLLALVVVNLVAALHALGAVLALGLFTLPAATAYLWCERWAPLLLTASLIGAGGAIAGFAISFAAGLPSGACLVTVLGAGFLISAIVSPRHGVIRRWLRPPAHHREDSEEVCAR